MTEKSSPTVNSYSVHEDQLKWFDVPLVAGGKAAVLHGDPTKVGTAKGRSQQRGRKRLTLSGCSATGGESPTSERVGDRTRERLTCP